jgi:hypothetical protein
MLYGCGGVLLFVVVMVVVVVVVVVDAHTHTHTHTNTLQRRTLIHTQDVLEKVGSIPEDILSRITAKILVGLTYLHRQKHMVRGGLGFCTLSSSAS